MSGLNGLKGLGIEYPGSHRRPSNLKKLGASLYFPHEVCSQSEDRIVQAMKLVGYWSRLSNQRCCIALESGPMQAAMNALGVHEPS
jgi:hypothetical protein